MREGFRQRRERLPFDPIQERRDVIIPDRLSDGRIRRDGRYYNHYDREVLRRRFHGDFRDSVFNRHNYIDRELLRRRENWGRWVYYDGVRYYHHPRHHGLIYVCYGDYYFWVHYDRDYYWWYHPYHRRWLCWRNGSWWGWDNTWIIWNWEHNDYWYGRDDGWYRFPDYGSTAPLEKAVYSPDGTRVVLIDFRENNSARLYEYPSYSYISGLGTGVERVQFVYGHNNELQIQVTYRDRSWRVYDRDGYLLYPVDSSPSWSNPDTGRRIEDNVGNTTGDWGTPPPTTNTAPAAPEPVATPVASEPQAPAETAPPAPVDTRPIGRSKPKPTAPRTQEPAAPLPAEPEPPLPEPAPLPHFTSKTGAVWYLQKLGVVAYKGGADLFQDNGPTLAYVEPSEPGEAPWTGLNPAKQAVEFISWDATPGQRVQRQFEFAIRVGGLLRDPKTNKAVGKAGGVRAIDVDFWNGYVYVLTDSGRSYTYRLDTSAAVEKPSF